MGGDGVAYRIVYEPVKSRTEQGRSVRRPVLTALCFALFLILVNNCWPQGNALLRELLIPGEPEVTLEALEVLADSIRTGDPLAEAVGAFCAAVMGGDSHGIF